MTQTDYISNKEDLHSRNRRIAKNTLLLYVRTFITMTVSLFTSRIMLEALGVDNYGINNVVAGIVSFSSLITGTMTAASSRYITYSLGEGKIDRMKTVFSTTANVQIILGVVAVIVLETFGVWFLNTTANIPPYRVFAANWVMQCSIITLFIGLSTVPFSATIVAHEKMSIYAYMSIADVCIKLIICYAIMSYSGDRLILYATLLVFSSIIITSVYAIFAYKQFEEVRYRRRVEKSLIREMLGYSGWNLLSNSSHLLSTQGISMLVNVFFGVAYNAARGIATTVNGAVLAFVGNFTMAFNPQITKSYAAKEYTYCFSLVNRGIKYTWFLIYIFLVPICMEAETLLGLWLVEVPPMSALFLRFVMFETIAFQSGQSLFTLIQANGNIKRYTVEVCLYVGLIFPLTWIAYKIGAPVWITYPLFIFIYFTVNIIRLRILTRLTAYDWHSYVKDVLRPCLPVSLISFIIPICIASVWSPSILRFFVLAPICVINTAITIYIIGLSPDERKLIIKWLKARMHRL